MAMNKYLSIITLNVNELNAPIKRHGIAEGQESMTHTYADLPQNKTLTQTESEGLETTIPSIWKRKKKKKPG